MSNKSLQKNPEWPSVSSLGYLSPAAVEQRIAETKQEAAEYFETEHKSFLAFLADIMTVRENVYEIKGAAKVGRGKALKTFLEEKKRDELLGTLFIGLMGSATTARMEQETADVFGPEIAAWVGAIQAFLFGDDRTASKLKTLAYRESDPMKDFWDTVKGGRPSKMTDWRAYLADTGKALKEDNPTWGDGQIVMHIISDLKDRVAGGLPKDQEICLKRLTDKKKLNDKMQMLRSAIRAADTKSVTKGL